MEIEIRGNDCAIISGYVNAVERRSKILKYPGAPPFREIVKAGTFQKSLDRGGKVELRLDHERTLCDTDSGLELREDTKNQIKPILFPLQKTVQEFLWMT